MKFRKNLKRMLSMLILTGILLSGWSETVLADYYDYGDYYDYNYQGELTGEPGSYYDWGRYPSPWYSMDPEKMSEQERKWYFYEIRFYDRSGNLSETSYVRKGSTLKLPVMASTRKYTFMGWDTARKKTADPQYIARQTITPEGDMDIYSVWFPKAKETDLKKKQLVAVKKSLYKEAVIVGDSRMMRTRIRMETLYGKSFQEDFRVKFVAIGGQTLANFRTKTDAYSEKALLKILKADNERKGKPIAVIFCLGVNDLHRVSNADSVVSRYLTYLERLKKKLSVYNVRLFFMSTNPVSSGSCSFLYEDGIQSFNEGMKAGLPEGYAFINTYKWLLKTGYSFDSGKSADSSIDDGRHYSTRTYKRILNYALRFINRG